MLLDKPRCPKCKALADATLETVPGFALLNTSRNGKATYTGETEMDWDAQRTVKQKGLATLRCENNHTWSSLIFITKE